MTVQITLRDSFLEVYAENLLERHQWKVQNQNEYGSQGPAPTILGITVIARAEPCSSVARLG